MIDPIPAPPTPTNPENDNLPMTVDDIRQALLTNVGPVDKRDYRLLLPSVLRNWLVTVFAQHDMMMDQLHHIAATFRQIGITGENLEEVREQLLKMKEKASRK
jgi:hypothetical protein